MRPLHKPLPPTPATRDAGAPVPLGQVNEFLLDALGDYCSYCEMRLGGGHIIHHKLRRDPPTAISLGDWPYLLLTCHDCRRHMTRGELRKEELADYLWPDVDPSFSLHPDSPLVYTLKPVPYIITGLDGSQERHDREFVFIEANPHAESTLLRKAANTIELFQLNSPYYDAANHQILIPRSNHLRADCNRLQQRTIAWKKAEASVSRLRQVRALPEVKANPGLEELMRQQMNHTANAKGNWSVWMTVFYRELGEKDLLARILLERPEDNPGFHFPGTNHGSLRWDAL